MSPSMTAGTSAELVRVLRHEHALVARLELSMASLRLLLDAGEGRFLPTASDEIHEVLDALAVVEAMRASLAEDLGGRVGITDAVSLDALADALPAEEGDLLRAVGGDLRDVIAQIEALGADGAGVAHSGLAQVRDVLERVAKGGQATAAAGATYERGGWGSRPAVSPVRFDGGA